MLRSLSEHEANIYSCSGHSLQLAKRSRRARTGFLAGVVQRGRLARLL